MPEVHVKTPWRVDLEVEASFEDRDETLIEIMTEDYGGTAAYAVSPEDAEFIVQACNSHEALVEAVKLVLNHGYRPADMNQDDGDRRIEYKLQVALELAEKKGYFKPLEETAPCLICGAPIDDEGLGHDEGCMVGDEWKAAESRAAEK